MKKQLFIFGFGYCAKALAQILPKQEWRIVGTSRKPEHRNALNQSGYTAIPYEHHEIAQHLAHSTHLLSSIAPSKALNDPVLAEFHSLIEQRGPDWQWVGYLSTIGVYGNTHGAWVDETAPTQAETPRLEGRIVAEQEWLTLTQQHHLPIHIFRLGGIYGPGRNALRQLKQQTARCIYKPEKVFSRIHVDDIAQSLLASIQHPMPGEIYNVCDDEPSASHEVIQYAAELLGISAPPLIPFEEAELSHMAKQFYARNRRVRNDKIKQQLQLKLQYPNYREGLKALLQQGVN